MFRSTRPSRFLLPGVAAAALALSGCAAGQTSQTAQQVAPIDGANADAGPIGIRNVLLSEPSRTNGYPAGSDARVLLYVSNIGLDADTLTSVSSTVAGSASIDGTAEVPPQSLVDMSTDTGVQIALEDLTRDVFFGESVPVTFTFETAGSMTVNVPIEVPTERSTDRPTVNILPAHPVPLWEEGSHGAEGGEGHGTEGGAEGHSAEGGDEAPGTAGGMEDHSAEGETEGHIDSTTTAAVPTDGSAPEAGSEG